VTDVSIVINIFWISAYGHALIKGNTRVDAIKAPERVDINLEIGKCLV